MTEDPRTARTPRERHQVFNDGEPSLAKQSFADSCDINNILAKYQKTGVIDHMAKHGPEYGDVSAISFTEAQQLVANATSMFNELPSRARDHFNNDPAQFLAYFDENEEPDLTELARLGLLDPGYTPPTPEKKDAPAAAQDASPEKTPASDTEKTAVEGAAS